MRVPVTLFVIRECNENMFGYDVFDAYEARGGFIGVEDLWRMVGQVTKT